MDSEITMARNTPFGPNPADVANQYASGICVSQKQMKFRIVGVRVSPAIINSQSSSVSFLAVSDNDELLFSESLESFSTFSLIFDVLAWVVLGIFLLSLGHKLIGAELLFNCQLVYLSCGMYSKVPFLVNSIGIFFVLSI